MKVLYLVYTTRVNITIKFLWCPHQNHSVIMNIMQNKYNDKSLEMCFSDFIPFSLIACM